MRDGESSAASTTLDPAEASASGDSSSGGSIKLDVGNGDGDGDGGDGGVDDKCKKVDLLFVVDNSTSMVDNQRNLAQNVPIWLDALRNYLGPNVADYHIGVTTSDVYRSAPEECKEIGALVTQTGGIVIDESGRCDLSITECGPFSDPTKSFLTSDDDLDTLFPCTAMVGECGDSNEKPVEAALAALSPELNASGACNDGFVRDDAVLVVIFVSDEPENTLGEAEDWFPQFIAVKGGIETNMVMVSLIGAGENPQPRDQCDIAGGANTKVEALTEMFTHGFVDHVCAPNYGESLSAALEGIKSACDTYVPVE